jgi:hypothetical protein
VQTDNGWIAADGRLFVFSFLFSLLTTKVKNCPLYLLFVKSCMVARLKYLGLDMTIRPTHPGSGMVVRPKTPGSGPAAQVKKSLKI